MDLKLTEEEGFALLEAVLCWDTAEYVPKLHAKNEALRITLQHKLEELTNTKPEEKSTD